MGRRSDHSREELKEMIILSSIEILKKLGTKKLEVRAIMKRIHYSIGTFYNVFKSFDVLVFHINVRTMKALVENVKTGLKPKMDLKKLGQKIAQNYIHFARSHSHEWSLLFNYPIQSDAPSWYLKNIELFFRDLDQTLFKILTSKNLKMAKIASRVLWSSLHGIFSLHLIGKLQTTTTEIPEKLYAHLFENYLKGQGIS